MIDEGDSGSEASLGMTRRAIDAIFRGLRKLRLAYLDRNFRFINVNAAFAEGCGLGPEELAGSDFFALGIDEGVRSLFVAARDSGEALEGRERPLTVSGGASLGDDWDLITIAAPDGRVEGLVLSIDEGLEARRWKIQAELLELQGASEEKLFDFTVEALAKTADSRFAFFGLMDEHETMMNIYAWSKETMAQCAVPGSSFHFPIAQSGLWGDCVRSRAPVLVQDYASFAGKRGYPGGHVPIRNFLGIPVFDGSRIVAIAAVANKARGYGEEDVTALRTLSSRILGIVHRKRAEAALKENEEKYRALFEEANDFVLIHSMGPNGEPETLLDANDAACRRLGYAKEELLKLKVKQFEDPRSFEGHISDTLELLRARGHAVFETVFVTKGGERLPVEIGTHEVRLNGKPYLMAIARDIGDRKRAEMLLRREGRLGEALLKLYETAPGLDDKELYDFALMSAVELTGSAIGFFHLVSEDQKEVILTSWNDEALKGCTASGEAHYRIDRAGNWVDCLRERKPVIYNDFPVSPNRRGLPEGHVPLRRFMSIPVIEDDKVAFIFGVGNKEEAYDENDATSIQLVANELRKICAQRRSDKNLREAREQIARKEKFSVMGQLAGRVGHELRNPLAVMGSALNLLVASGAGAEGSSKEYLEAIRREIDNSERILSDLLDFARTKAPRPRSIKASELIELAFARCPVPAGIEVALELREDLRPLFVDAFQACQVIQNLVTNGMQAMPNGGKLTVAARDAAEAPEKEVEISVADTGVGISPDDMGKLFQPLFTTKEKGVGLGLAICKDLVEANGGTIGVESEVGRGTVFRVRLPFA
jgi:PAS domain S-box-containing protein